jgi:hypothetical protein
MGGETCSGFQETRTLARTMLRIYSMQPRPDIVNGRIGLAQAFGKAARKADVHDWLASRESDGRR